jgi:tRNA-specific 2-thiouridylase
MCNKSVVIGMSGGVDSSVAALLLKQQGFNVTGVFMKNWEEDDKQNYCHASQDLYDAEQVCNKLNIPLCKVNFAAEYWEQVFSIFLQEYQSSRTPNPDVLCNKEIKFKVFLNYAKQLNADFIATGHYARINKNNNTTYLLTGTDSEKDQSYFLHGLTEQQLENCLFPLGELNKKQVRDIAKKFHLDNYDKKDSTGICFIGERKFKDFLEKYIPNQPGEIITDTNEVIGNHDGLMYYTIGQRKGLKIGGQTKYKHHHNPWYVIDKNINKNQLIVSNGSNNNNLYATKLLASNIHWINQSSANNNQDNFACYARIRYRQSSQKCWVNTIAKKNHLIVKFNEPQRAITPGQYIVFYLGETCLGGATIEKALYE